MNLLPRLWQRILAYAILLIIASHVVSFAVFNFGFRKAQNIRFMSDMIQGVAAAIEGKDLEDAGNILSFMNASGRIIFWLEKPDGELLLGKPLAGLNHRQKNFSRKDWGVAFSESDLSAGGLVGEKAVMLRGGEAALYLSLEERPAPPLLPIFVQGLSTVCIIGGALSVWIAWHISRPLRRLREEALDIGAGNLERRVTETGQGEIAEVASAVNSLAGNLSRNIRGMQELLANISHEMRSPLARMNISTVIIEEELAKGEAKEAGRADFGGNALVLKQVGNIQTEIELLEKLVGTTLLTSKLDLQQHRFEMQSVQLSGLCEEMARRHELQMEQAGVAFCREIEPDLWVLGDEAMLCQVVSNLLDNAAKYTTQGGLAELKLFRDGSRARLCLENTCAKLDEKNLERLFEPFYRGRRGAGDNDGVGLGLALVEKIVKAHAGRVGARNGRPGLVLEVCLDLYGAPGESAG